MSEQPPLQLEALYEETLTVDPRALGGNAPRMSAPTKHLAVVDAPETLCARPREDFFKGEEELSDRYLCRHCREVRDKGGVVRS